MGNGGGGGNRTGVRKLYIILKLQKEIKKGLWPNGPKPLKVEYVEVDLKSGLIINGEITQSISGTKAKYKENSEDELDNEFPQDAMIMKVDTNINAKSRICGSSDGFGDCTSIWTE